MNSFAFAVLLATQICTKPPGVFYKDCYEQKLVCINNAMSVKNTVLIVDDSKYINCLEEKK